MKDDTGFTADNVEDFLLGSLMIRMILTGDGKQQGRTVPKTAFPHCPSLKIRYPRRNLISSDSRLG